MARFEVLLVSLAFLFGVTSASNATNVTECHICQSPGDAYCNDPYDSSLGKTGKCSELTRSVFTDITNEERITNATSSFVCIKLDVSYSNATDGVIRGCFREVDNVETCSFFRAEQNSYTVKGCNVCREDKCNSGTYLQVSAVLVGAIMFLTSKI